MTSDTAVGTEDQLVRAGVRRAGKRLVPLLALLYFINYLDRVNIGFAGPNGMNQELGSRPTMFGLASGVFFIGYLLLEVPSNMALHRFGARRWIARIMVSWGIVATAMACVPERDRLYILRFLLGVAEAGFFPGIILYLTYWFPPGSGPGWSRCSCSRSRSRRRSAPPCRSWIIQTATACSACRAGG